MLLLSWGTRRQCLTKHLICVESPLPALWPCVVLQVNKADQIEATEGLSSEETKQYVANLVTRQLEGDGFHLEPDQVGSA